jgi:hypothetical protein
VNAAAHLANVELLYQAPIKPWSHRDEWYAKDRVMETMVMLRLHGVACWDLLAGCVAFELWCREGQPRWPQRLLDHVRADMILRQATGLTKNERLSWDTRAAVKQPLASTSATSWGSAPGRSPTSSMHHQRAGREDPGMRGRRSTPSR